MTFELTVLGLLGLAVLWWDFNRAKHRALAAARRACRAEGVQLLDASVALSGTRLVFAGKPRLHRSYGFEYSRWGVERNRGSVFMEGQRVVSVVVDPVRPPSESPSASLDDA